MTNDMQQLHDKGDELLLRGLSDAMRRLRSRSSEVSQATKTPARRPLVPTDAAGVVRPDGDIGCGETASSPTNTCASSYK